MTLICIFLTRVSVSHAELKVKMQDVVKSLWLFDLGNTNGLPCDGKRVRGLVQLQDGDLLNGDVPERITAIKD